MSQISNCRFLEKSKSTDAMADEYWTRMLVLSQRDSKHALNMHLIAQGELD